MALQRPEDPFYPAEDLYGIVGDNLKKSFEVKEVSVKQKKKKKKKKLFVQFLLSMQLIGHFLVPLSLSFKTSESAKSL